MRRAGSAVGGLFVCPGGGWRQLWPYTAGLAACEGQGAVAGTPRLDGGESGWMVERWRWWRQELCAGVGTGGDRR